MSASVAYTDRPSQAARAEGIADLKKKFETEFALKIAPKKAARIYEIVADQARARFYRSVRGLTGLRWCRSFI